MTKRTRELSRKVAKVERRWRILRKPSPSELVYRIDELWTPIIQQADVMDLLSYRGMDVTATTEADDEMDRRMRDFMKTVVTEDKVDSLLGLMRRQSSGFGGYEVLKLFAPACKEHKPPPQRIFTLFTPAGNYQVVTDFFYSLGFRMTHTDGDTLEHRRCDYGDAIRDSINLRSPYGRIFVDIVESVNDVAFYPCFKMATTLHMHCLMADCLIIPYGKLSCQRKGIINPVHATGKYLLALEPAVQDAVNRLRKTCNVELHRNPRKLSPHKGRCGSDPNCLHTLRSTVSPGSVIYPFKKTETINNNLLNFMPHDGVIWRLGGWSCYPEGMYGLRPVLALASQLHAAYEGQDVAQLLPGNMALLHLLGWD